MEEFRKRLEELMLEHNMKPIDVSNATLIPKSTISNYMSGRMIPKAHRIHELSVFFGVDEAWLMGYDVEKNRAKAEKSRKMFEHINDLYDQLTFEQQETVVSLMETMVNQNKRKKEVSSIS